MYDDIRNFIDVLGGYRAVATRLSMAPTTLHGYLSEGTLPAKWYGAFLALSQEQAVEPPPRRFFSFEVLPARPALGDMVR